MKTTWMALSLLLLLACGGEEPCETCDQTPPPCMPDYCTPVSTDLPSVPLLVASYAPKELQFLWSQSTGAVCYRLYQDPDASGTFTQITGDLTDNAYDLEISVHLFDWADARFRLDACNDLGCTPSNEISVTGHSASAVGRIIASNTESGDDFGSALAVSADGSTLVVGAYGQGNSYPTNAGAAYIFVRSGSAWTEQKFLKASNAAQNDNFGRSVAVSDDGNTVAVGADKQNSMRGAVYIFTRSGITWTQQDFFTSENAQAADYFGHSVSLSSDGNTLAVGAYGEDLNANGINPTDSNNGAPTSGAAYIFTRTGTDWSQQAFLKASNTGAEDYFGKAVALSGDGNTLLVGAPQEDGDADASLNEGAVYIFTRSGTTWTQRAYVKPENHTAGHFFGSSVDFTGDGTTFAAGSPSATHVELGAGVAYVFTGSGATWTQDAYLQASDPAYGAAFGSVLSFSGDGAYLAIGAPTADGNAPGINEETLPGIGFGDTGVVYLFARGSAWDQTVYVQGSSVVGGENFGTAVTLDGDGSELIAGSGMFSQRTFFY